MALVFHDGFETGGADAWDSVIGSPAFNATAKHSGDYGMECDASNSYITITPSPTPNRISFRFKYGADCTTKGTIFRCDTDIVEVKVNTNKTLCLVIGAATDDGSTILQAATSYRISLSRDGNDIKLYLDGNEECSISSSDGFGGMIRFGWWIGAYGSSLYFDDFAADDTVSIDDLGDIRVLALRPNGEGSHQDTGTGSKWQDSDNTPAVFTEIDNDPPNTTDYNWCETDGDTNDYSVELGDFSLLGATIEAVNFMWYYDTDGGGVGDYASLIQDQGSDTIDWTIDDPKDPTWLNSYKAACPSDGDPWTQDNFADVEIGMSCKDAGKDMWFYEAYAMIAFIPAEAPPTVPPMAFHHFQQAGGL